MAKPLSEIMKSIDAEMAAEASGIGAGGDTIFTQPTRAAPVASPAEPRSLLEAMTALDGRLRVLESGVAAMRLAFDALATISGLKP